MREVMKHIFDRKRSYDQLPLFQWMRDETLEPVERLAFYPCMAHFIMSFGDLNKFVLREERAGDEYQQMVNAHTFEDDHHWPWYLEDFAKLGFDAALPASDFMRFLWGDETKQNRILLARLTSLIQGTHGLERLVIIEAIEETGNVLFGTILPLAQRLEREMGVELRYCGAFHFDKESGHAVGADHAVLARAPISDVERERFKRVVDEVFASFEAWTHELLRYALAHPIRRPAAVPAKRATSRSATFLRTELIPEEFEAAVASSRRG